MDVGPNEQQGPAAHPVETPASSMPRPGQDIMEAGPWPSEQQGTQQGAQPDFRPNPNPTHWGEFQRSIPSWVPSVGGPEKNNFWRGTFSDVPKYLSDEIAQGYQALTETPENFLDAVNPIHLGKRLLGAARIAGATLPPSAYLEAATPPVAHGMTALLHMAGSALAPKQAALEVPDTLTEPYGHYPPRSPLAHDLVGPEPDKPHAPFTERMMPAVQTAMAFGAPTKFSLSAQDIFDAGSAGYKRAAKLGAQFDQPTVNTMVDRIENVLERKGFPGYSKEADTTWKALEKLREIQNPTINDFDIIRRTIHAAKEDASPFAIASMDDHLSNPKLLPTLITDPAKRMAVVQELQTARKNWAAASRAEAMDTARAAAELHASSQTSTKEMGDLLIKEATKLLDPRHPERLAGWSDAEKAQLGKVVTGTVPGRLAKRIGKVAPGLPWGHEASENTFTGLKDLAWSALGYANPWIGVPTALATGLAKHIGETSAVRQWDKANELLRHRAPATAELGALRPVPKMRTMIPQAAYIARQVGQGQ